MRILVRRSALLVRNFSLAILAVATITCTTAAAECEKHLIEANATFIRATVHCKRNYMDTPAGYYALAMSKQCNHLSEGEFLAIAKTAMLRLDEMVKQKGRAAACKFVDKLEKSLIKDLKGFSATPTEAQTWFFTGKCEDSRVKRGSLSEDPRIQVGDKINCDIAIVSILTDGRLLVQFRTGLGVLGFAGAVLDETTYDTPSIPIETIYPIRDLGMSKEEILQNSLQREGALTDGVEGICLLGSENFKSMRKMTCTAKHEVAEHGSVYSITINITRGARRDIPGL